MNFHMLDLDGQSSLAQQCSSPKIADSVNEARMKSSDTVGGDEDPCLIHRLSGRNLSAPFFPNKQAAESKYRQSYQSPA